MKKTLLIIVLAGLSALKVPAQTSANWTDYFQRTLSQSDFTDIPLPAGASAKIAADEVANKRRTLWTAWQEAVRHQALPSLIAAGPLADSLRGAITLPDSLEPNAVMPYYYGTKGSISMSGNTSVPTFLYLHGSGPKAHEWAAGISWCLAFADAPSRYFIPQIPNEGGYYRWWQRSKQWTWTWLWRQLMLQPDIDPDRIYLLGISEGGYGSQRLASFYADYLAAAGPMAGGEPLINAPAENLGHIGFSLLTGEQDLAFCRNRYTQITGQTLDSLTQTGWGDYAHRVELQPGRGHGIDYRPTTPWLTQFRRTPCPRRFVWEDFAMDGCRRKGFYNIRPEKHYADSLRLRYEVNMSVPNEVDIAVSEVRYEAVETDTVWHLTLNWHKSFRPVSSPALTIFFNEQLVDFSRPVTIRLNGRQVFRGRLKPTAGAMAESLATYGDPKRIFSAMVRIGDR